MGTVGRGWEWRKGHSRASGHVAGADTGAAPAGILGGVNGRLAVAGLMWAAVSVFAFWAIGNVVVAGGLAVFGLVLLVVLAMASDWDRHPDFEERERVRARRRQEKWERNAGARARDRERWDTHQARKAARGTGQDR